MNHRKLKLALRIACALLLAGHVTSVAFAADEAKASLAPSDILQKAQEKYASLTSYTDEGKTVATLNGMTITSTFTIKLARPDLYRVEWTQTSESPLSTTTTKPQAVWSAGEGHFLDMGRGVEKQKSQNAALGGATGISGGAAASVPGTFFEMNWGNQLKSLLNAKPQPDEKVGDVDCYVLTNETKGRTRTLWIGKQDFLIHQIRNVTDAEAMKAALNEAAKDHPAMREKLPKTVAQGITSIETHTNLVLNPKLSAADFDQPK